MPNILDRIFAAEDIILKAILPQHLYIGVGESILSLNAPPTILLSSITFNIFTIPDKYNMESACKNNNKSPSETLAPAFICSPLPLSEIHTLSANLLAVSTVLSLLPPSATIISADSSLPIAKSCFLMEARFFSIRDSSFKVGIIMETFIQNQLELLFRYMKL